MRVSDFDFFLPEELIAQQPVEPRDHSRLLVLFRQEKRLEHRYFYQLPEYLRAGDVLVVNETRVIPARLFGEKKGTGARIEVVLLHRIDKDRWEVLLKPGKRARPGTWLQFGDGLLEAEVEDVTPAGGRILRFVYRGVWEELLDRLGEMPLPPYIREKLPDRERYQTVYAREEGSAAAPTAGLHFTPRLLAELQERGIEIVKVLLHVGLGTFRPVKVEKIEEHQMHAEYYRLSAEAAQVLNRAKAEGRRVIAVGTTSTRVLETAAVAPGQVQAGEGWTDIFIYPGYQFKMIDGLITNFHLPKSTLLMLVAALVGRERILAAYEEAVRERYRFFSFGDAMLII
ncbi:MULTISPECIES: tRNA preQ1(34) S-adenosylmethionine ribosyltransferase-isomerase QueA [Carboxydocella]|uniref:S-adenosylmethionine:tRNA ribosyltransferase-isomerase n=2 Tax=Carboxydocella TaxID=178898 RepID=A0A1T4PHN2_9FIRM|nr:MULTISPECIES: tRNA preQ1(34) S-adenosylmethionine ribosyltransferase-isomerase QueA [Carboxydocella]AVX21471.1 S-adenosylmethionine--tRNA ribosyltransferase-isomerase [Carboxydocella thermautotrophica]AVX31959.1 S-adenosylmethionine--tRNA ribosyltransferase-isomerase [Carboxydocella thermautotrophica]SJZ90827.1 S-adenosylmethionine--tRNA ribosyltransferase-isomerase [Carboxydocella sporoproducens DSM 16521]GAW29216.1 S-adenosylmethionine:tRNA ribosyltransferase-isomerase [Carboxydocella sp. 